MALRQNSTRQSYRVFLWLFVAVVFATTLSVQIWNNLQETARLKQTMQIIQIENTQVQTKKIELQTQVELLTHDEYVLKLARARGFYSLPNELIFNITEQNGLLSNEKARQEALNNNE